VKKTCILHFEPRAECLLSYILAAHLLGFALEQVYSQEGCMLVCENFHSATQIIKIICQASGPPVEGSGFFYDAFIGKGNNSIPISTKKLSALEICMRKLSAASHPFERCRVTPSAAAAMFAGNVFKERVIDAASARGEQLTVYRCGPFVDLCRY
jgi:threonyl-tRNA synthetase